jgi:hypothetical protein
VPIAFHDVGDVDELGSAGFLKLELVVADDQATVSAVAGLLVINARGEPLEFAFNRAELRHRELWGERRARGHVQRRLVASLLSVCSYDPRLLVCLADEIDTDLFERELHVEVSIVRIAELAAPAQVTWQPAAPIDDSAEQRLFERLGAHGLLLEPFERASHGLREVYGES